MAKRSKRPTNTTFLDDFAASPLGSDPAPEADEGEKTKQPSVEDLLGQITALNDRLDRADKLNMALMADPQHGNRQPQQRKAPTFDASKLPDAAMDPEGFNRAVTSSIKEAVDYEIANMRDSTNREQDQVNRAKALWDRFSNKYGDYAKDQDKVEYAASRVAQEAKAKGLDLEKYMFGQGQDYFLDDVKAQMEKTFGKVKGKDEDIENEPEDDGRSLSIFGGLESGGRPSNKGDDLDKGDMVKELQDMQRKSGFY